MKAILFFILIFPFLKLSSSSQVIRVPEDYAKIQEAIDAASTRDSVIVGPGEYFENINFRGKAIVVASKFTYSGVFSDIAETIIDGSSPLNPDTASCVVFCSGEGGSSVLEGFTLRKGTGTRWIDPQFPDYTWQSGGGIFIFGSSPSIRNNQIINNDVSDPRGADGASGGGIIMYNANPRICNNIIKANKALYGCGVVVDYSGGTFKNNIIEENSGGQSYGGGAFWTIGNGNKPIIIENNTLVNNQVLGSGAGGAFYIWSTSTITARNNIIWGNTQSSGNQIFLTNGGQIDISYSDIQGGYPGEGNIDSDPLIVHYAILDPSSPCIDSGNPESLFNDTEDNDNPGLPLYPSAGSLRNDMGAYGGQGSNFIYNMVSSIDHNDYFGKVGQGAFVYPNPFDSQLIITLPESIQNEVSVKLFDQQGELIYSDNFQGIIGEKNINFGRPIKKGIYFLSLESEGKTQTSKLIKK